MKINKEFDKNYPYWRDEKLKNFQSLDNCLVELKNTQELSLIEKNKIKELCKTNNFALIQTPKALKYDSMVLDFNTQLGLIQNDKHLFISSNDLAHITPVKNKQQGEFIPYTNKKINWHTDGYYNDLEHRVRSFTLFCAKPAKSGGVNNWLDIEMLYILFREKDEKLIKLLSLIDSMTIPAHTRDNKVLRVESKDAIFLTDNKTNSLYMRYTQRKKNIYFHNEVLEAVNLLDTILEGGSDYHHQHKMLEGQGIINNNVIHTRSSFVSYDKEPRVMLRGRYFVRV